jgi:hypothetical protein
MRILSALWLLAQKHYYNWAFREIDPMHKDVPEIVLKRQQIADDLQLLWR